MLLTSVYCSNTSCFTVAIKDFAGRGAASGCGYFPRLQPLLAEEVVLVTAEADTRCDFAVCLIAPSFLPNRTVTGEARGASAAVRSTEKQECSPVSLS